MGTLCHVWEIFLDIQSKPVLDAIISMNHKVPPILKVKVKTTPYSKITLSLVLKERSQCVYVLNLGLFHGRVDLVLQQVPVSELVDPLIYWQELGPIDLCYFLSSGLGAYIPRSVCLSVCPTHHLEKNSMKPLLRPGW